VLGKGINGTRRGGDSKYMQGLGLRWDSWDAKEESRGKFICRELVSQKKRQRWGAGQGGKERGEGLKGRTPEGPTIGARQGE